MKKTWVWSIVAAVALVFVGAGFYYSAANGPKIVFGSVVLSKSVDGEGKPIDAIQTVTRSDKEVYVSARFKPLFARGAKMIWYKGEVSVENRIKVDDLIPLSKKGYAYSKLDMPEGFSAGDYTVNLYAASKQVIEDTIRFKVEE